MKIRFNNVGNIKNFDFELKKGLTLLCGQNNTGKTYAAYIVFSILTRFEEIPAKWITESELAILLTQGSLVLDLKKFVETDEFLKDISRKLARFLTDDFDAPKEFFGKECIRISELHNRIKTTRSQRSEINFGSTKVNLALKKDTITISASKITGEDDLTQFPRGFLHSIINSNISSIFSARYLGQVHVLTAERTAVNLFSRELSSSRNNLVDQLLGLENLGKNSKQFNLENILGHKTARYSLPIRKGLEIAEDLKNISRTPGEFAPFAEELETLILGGKIQIGEFGELIYKRENSALRINLAASMIKSLASLVVYLRYQAHKGNLLIIDEPELNLHPDSQCKIARFLCELANAGLDILISTHSDYIIREINNSILLNHPSLQDVKTKYGYRDTQLIAPDMVSVVLFNAEGFPEQLPVGKKGFAIASIDAEINLLNQLAEDIEMEWEE